MKRRDIIKCTAVLSGAALGAPLLSSLLSGCGPQVATDSSELSFFNTDDFNMVSSLTDIILPRTDSPSATEVGVHNMIDTMVGQVYSELDREKYLSNWNALKKHLSNDFLQKESTDQLELLKSLETSTDLNLKDAKQSFRAIKQQTIAYYLSTEEVGTKFLNYLPVPGEYEGCIELSSVNGKAWAI